MSCGVLERELYVTELHAYDFVMKDVYVIKKGVLFVPDPVYYFWSKREPESNQSSKSNHQFTEITLK